MKSKKENIAIMDEKEMIKKVQDAKSNGSPYAEGFDEAYKKMTEEERTEADAILTKLTELLGSED